MTDRGLAALAAALHGWGYDCISVIRDDVEEPTHLQLEAAARILGERGVFLPDDSAVRAFTAWLASDGPEDQATIARLRTALASGVQIMVDLTAWAGKQYGGLPQTLQDRADWWRLDIDPALAGEEER